MKKIKFGFSQIRNKTPQFVHWITVSGAGIMTALAALQALYPLYITDHLIAETGKILAAIRIICQLFGIDHVETPATIMVEKEATTDKDNGTTTV